MSVPFNCLGIYCNGYGYSGTMDEGELEMVTQVLEMQMVQRDWTNVGCYCFKNALAVYS